MRQALVINKLTAKVLVIIIPQSRADEVPCSSSGVWRDQVVNGVSDTPNDPNQKRNGPGRAATEAVLALEVRS